MIKRSSLLWCLVGIALLLSITGFGTSAVNRLTLWSWSQVRAESAAQRELFNVKVTEHDDALTVIEKGIQDNAQTLEMIWGKLNVSPTEGDSSE